MNTMLLPVAGDLPNQNDVEVGTVGAAMCCVLSISWLPQSSQPVGESVAYPLAQSPSVQML